MVAVFAIANLFALNFIYSQTNIKQSYATSCTNNSLDFFYNDQTFTYFPDTSGVSKIRLSIANESSINKYKIINNILSMGFSLEQAINYLYPGLENFLNNLATKINVTPQDAMPYAMQNNCKIAFKEMKNGYKIDKNGLYNQIFNNLSLNKIEKINVKTVVDYAKVCKKDIKDKFKLAGSFYTSFSSSGAQRRHNIQTAINAINGTIIKAGETISFNKLTGERNQENDYQTAKIIVGGRYTEGVGGGVCQVSTTMYNACLLAGLDISEVHNHSLPASYVMPCFDAMVNFGTSDLKITNNTGGDCIIAAACIGDICKVCVYGKTPKYKLVRRYQKYQDLPAGEDLVECDANKYPNIDLLQNNLTGDIRVSYGIDGYRAYGYLDYYEGDTLIKTVKIRDNTYNPKKGVVLHLD